MQTNHLTAPQLARIIPNAITVTALCTGLSAIRFALVERWELSVSLILIAAILDAMGELQGFCGRLVHLALSLILFLTLLALELPLRLFSIFIVFRCGKERGGRSRSFFLRVWLYGSLDLIQIWMRLSLNGQRVSL